MKNLVPGSLSQLLHLEFLSFSWSSDCGFQLFLSSCNFLKGIELTEYCIHGDPQRECGSIVSLKIPEQELYNKKCRAYLFLQLNLLSSLYNRNLHFFFLDLLLGNSSLEA